MPQPSLRRNLSWALVGNLAYAGAQLGALVLLARLGSVELLGRYSLGLAVSAPVMLFADLKLRQVQATDQSGEFAFADYAGLRLLTLPAALALVALVAWANPAYATETAAAVTAVALAKAVESLSDLAYGQCLRHERNDLVTRSQLLRGAWLLVAMAVGVGLAGDLLVAVGLQAAGWAVVAAIDLWAAAELGGGGFRPRWDPATLRRLAWTALPLGAVVAMGSLQVNVPRYALDQAHGQAALGAFAALAYVLVAQDTVIGAMGMAASPRLAKLWADGDRAGFGRLTARLVGGGLGLGAVGLLVAVVAGRPLLWLVYGPEFADQGALLVRLMVAVAVTNAYVFLGTAINAMRRFRTQVPLHLVGLVAVVGFSVAWVPSGAALGAANALIATAVVSLVAYAVALGLASRSMASTVVGR